MTTTTAVPGPTTASDDLVDIDDFIVEDPAAAPSTRSAGTLMGWLTTHRS